MAQGTDEMMKLSANMAQGSNAAMQATLDGMRRLTEVNLEAARASLEQSAAQIHALLAAKDVNALTQLVTAMAQPSPEKFTAYAQAVTAIARDTQNDLARVVREQVERANQQIAATVEAMARTAPTGSEGAMSFIRQAMQSTSASYEQFNQNMQRALDIGTQGMQQGAAPASAPNARPAASGTRRR